MNEDDDEPVSGGNPREMLTRSKTALKPNIHKCAEILRAAHSNPANENTPWHLAEIGYRGRLLIHISHNSLMRAVIHNVWPQANIRDAMRGTPSVRGHHFLPASMASPFLHATILIFGAVTISFCSILNAGFFTMNVHTSSQRRYVWR